MATISTIQVKRGTKAALEKVLRGDSKPLSGELIYETDTNKIKVGDGVNDYVSMPYLTCSCDDVVPVEFYATRANFPIIGEVNKLYVDKTAKTIYGWDGTQYYVISGGGSTKLYDSKGQNTDGAMTQKAVTDLSSGVKLAIKEDDDECLILVNPWAAEAQTE